MSKKLTSLAAATALAVAACSFAVPAKTMAAHSGTVLLQVTPAGEFLPSDGRAMDSPPWNIDAASAERVIARYNAAAAAKPLVIDYEHQTLNKEKNGQPAPAAGWFRGLKWLEGQGLYAVVELTARARQYIGDNEYLYFSPVFEYDRHTGTVLAVHMGALTNNPAIHGMAPLSLLAAATAAFLPPQQPEPTVNPLLKALLAALGLPDTTTEPAAIAALTALGPLSIGLAQAAAARTALALPADASADAVVAACTSLRTTAAATPAAPDPTKFVSVDVVEALRTNIAALTARQLTADIDAAVAPALADGRLLPAQEAWARDLGKTNLAALNAYIASAQPIAALTATQTQGKPPTAVAAGALTPDQLAVCSAMGMTPEQFAAGAPGAAAVAKAA